MKAAVTGRWLLPLLLIPALYVMLTDRVNLGAAAGFVEPAGPGSLPLPQPWGGSAWLDMALLAGAAAEVDPETALVMLEARVRNYPIDPRHWLDLARIHARQGNDRRVGELLAKAYASRPEARDALWTAAQIALQSGNAALAERQLRLWLAEFPADTERALFIGSRWIEDPGALLDRMLPPGRAFLGEAMRVARRQRNPELAEAIWARLDPRPQLDDPEFLDYAELAFATEAFDRLRSLWAERDPTYDGSGVANGGFSRPLGEPFGLNWRTNRAPTSVRVERDPAVTASPPASLRVTFNGKENIRLAAPSIRMIVGPEAHYRLAGQWRAEGLTTRALPYLQLQAPGSRLRERLDAPTSSFDWQDWQIEFATDAEMRIVELTLRRDRTNNFDRNIGGSLWLDEVTLERIETPEPVPSISELLRDASGG